MADNTLRIKIQLLVDEARQGLRGFNDDLNNMGGASAGTDRLNAATQEARRNMDNLSQSGLGLNKVMQSLAGAFSLFALYAGGKKLIEIADNMKLIDGRITVATASTLGAAEAAKNHTMAYAGLLDISQRTGTSFEANATLFARINLPMQQMGGSIKNALAFTEMLSKGLVISGAAAGETASVIRQMSQAMASGVLRGDEFNSIMENSPRIAQALADGLGKNVGQLRAMAEAGELTADKVMPALMGQAEKINAEYAKMPATVQRSFERVKNAFDQYIAGVDKGKGVTDGLAGSFDDLANNIVPVVEAVATAGRILITVWAVQAVQALASYGQAQMAAMTAKRELIALEKAHSQALVMNAELTLNNVTARKAQIQADLQAAAGRLNLARAEVQAAQAEVTATAGTTAHGNAVYRLTVAQQELTVVTAQVSTLGRANAVVTAEQTAATTTLNAARQAQNVTLWQSIAAMTAAEKAMGAMNAAMSVFMGWQIGTAIGDWLNGFKAVRDEALATVAVFDKMITTFGMFAKAAKASVTGGDMEAVMAQYKQDINAIETNRDEALAYSNKGEAAPEAGDTNIKVNASGSDASHAKEAAKAEQATIADSFKLKEQLAKNAYDVEIAKAGHNAALKLQIEKDYNDKAYRLTLSRLEAEKTTAIKMAEAEGKKDSPDLKAKLAKIDNEKTAAQSDFQTQQTKLGISQQEQSQQLLEAKQDAQFDLEKSKIELDLAASKAEVKTALDDLKRGFEQGGNANASPVQANDKTSYALTKFMQMGWSKEQSAGIVANLHRESGGFSEDVVSGKRLGDGGKAVGIGQWHPDRQADFKAQFGKSLKGSSMDEQLAFVDWELKNTESSAGSRLKNANSAREAGGIVSQYYERPKDVSGEKQHRGGHAEKLASGFSGGDIKQLEQQDQTRINQYYAKRKELEDAGIAANVKAIQAKLVLLDKDYTAKKDAAKDAPEKLPKIEADYQTEKAKLVQDLKQLNGELLSVQKAADAEMKAELDKAKTEAIDSQETADLELIKIAETESQQQLELGQLSNGKFLEKQQDFEDQRYQIALKAAQDRRRLLDEGDVSGKAKALGAEKALTNKHAADLKRINHKMALDSKAAFNSMVSPIKSAFSSSIQGILQGTTTLKKGMKNAFQSIVLSYAGSLANMAIDAAAHWAWELFGFGVKETTKTGIKVAGETAQTGATIVGTQTRVAAEQIASAESAAIEFESGMKKIANKAVTAAAGAYDAMIGIPYVGPIVAPIAAAATFVAVMAFGSLMSSEGGEWDVPNDRLNLVHKNETILPANIAAPMREFFTSQGNVSYGLPDSVTQPTNNQAAGVMVTAASALAQQQLLMQSQQKQQRQANSGTVVINGKGGDWVHKDDIVKILKNDNRNFRTA
jgi:tape measure domain-containing protein